MSYSNEFLRNFRPVFFGILLEKQIQPERVELEIIDEEGEGLSVFEPAGVQEVLEQLAGDLNFLTIYTKRPAYFYPFAETMYEENGLIVRIFPKEMLHKTACAHKVSRTKEMQKHGGDMGKKSRTCFAADTWQLVLDFEWEGKCYTGQMRPGRYYIPIHKKPWEQAENLDIMVPIGYNTVIVKSLQDKRKKPGQDRLEAAFYDV